MSQSNRKILIVEDERALSLALASTVKKCGGRPVQAATLAKAAEQMEEQDFAGMILDIGLPDGNGLSFLESLDEAKRPATLLVTAHGEIENAITARKIGVMEFFDKPIDFPAFTTALKTLLRGEEKDAPTAPSQSTFIGAAPAMREVFQKIAHACASREPALIVGETGTGKSTAASLIANHTAGENSQLVRLLHSSSTPDEIEQAVADKSVDAIVIDPVSHLSMEAQDALTSFFEKENPSPRVIATAGMDMMERVTDGSFRSDLYYRLQVLEIRLPRLNRRTEDIPALANYFLGLLEPGRHVEIEASVFSILEKYDWPGNIRELENTITFARTVAKSSSTLESAHLPEHLRVSVDANTLNQDLASAIEAWLNRKDPLPAYKELSGEVERVLLEELLKRFGGKIAPLANALDANRTTIRKKLQFGQENNEA